MDIIEFKKDSCSLFDKYAPKSIADILGCKKQVNAIVNWLKNYEANAKINIESLSIKKNKIKTRKKRIKEIVKDANVDTDDGISGEGDTTEDIINTIEKCKKKDPNTCSCAIITGDHGTGKTAVVKAILTDMGYRIKSVNFAKVGSIKSVNDFVNNLLTSDDIYDNFEGVKCRKYAVIVDEIQSAITPAEKNIIVSLSKTNFGLWGCPVIFIGSNKHKKIMIGIKKECYHISMYPPDAENMLSLLEKVGIGEGIVLQNENVAIDIINYSQNDYRRLMVILGELHRLHGSDVIKKTDIVNNIKFTGEKDIDRSIFENTSRLFSKYEGINRSLKVFGFDKTNMPLMVHQNHFLATNKYIKDKTKLIDVSYDITDNLAKGDVVENFIYSGQNWPLQETYGFYSCVYPSYTIGKHIDVSRLAYDSKNPYYRPAFISQFPKDLNRTSTKCINYKKNIKPADEFFKDMTIDDYVIAVKIIKNLLEDGRIEECKDILKSYNLSSQGIMYILKMDKINGTRKDVPKSVENKVKHIAVEPIKPIIIKKN